MIRIASTAIFGFVLLLATVSVRPAQAAELLMYFSDICPWCEAWDEDIGVIYGKTTEAKMLPLRKVDIDEPFPADLGGVKGVVFTPTFVVVENGREIGRIIGYASEDFFWGYLGGLMGKLHRRRAELN